MKKHQYFLWPLLTFLALGCSGRTDHSPRMVGPDDSSTVVAPAQLSGLWVPAGEVGKELYGKKVKEAISHFKLNWSSGTVLDEPPGVAAYVVFSVTESERLQIQFIFDESLISADFRWSEETIREASIYRITKLVHR